MRIGKHNVKLEPVVERKNAIDAAVTYKIKPKGETPPNCGSPVKLKINILSRPLVSINRSKYQRDFCRLCGQALSEAVRTCLEVIIILFKKALKENHDNSKLYQINVSWLCGKIFLKKS